MFTQDYIAAVQADRLAQAAAQRRLSGPWRRPRRGARRRLGGGLIRLGDDLARLGTRLAGQAPSMRPARPTAAE